MHGVQLEVPGGERGDGLGRRAPADRPEAREELLKAKGLRKVVVCPEVQSPDPVLDCGPGAEDEDGRRPVAGPQLAQDLEAALAGEHHIQDESVVVGPERELEPQAPIRCHIHGESVFLQPLPDAVQKLRVIFNDEDSHEFHRPKWRVSRYRGTNPFLMLGE